MTPAIGARRAASATMALLLAATSWTAPIAARAADAPSADAYLVVDCLLPGQVRKLGRSQVFMTPRRPIRTSGQTCEIRGGEYVSADRATFASSMAVWLPTAQQGDAKAQAYVGRIYAEGFDRAPDYVQAAGWYQKAGDQGYSQAMIDLGQLYERGLGVPKDPVRAVNLYRKATGLPATDFASADAVASPAAAKRNAQQEAELTAARAELAAARAELAKVQPASAAAPSAAELKAAQAERAQALAQRDELQRDLAALRTQLPDAQGRLADLEVEVAQARRAAAQANARLATTLTSLEGREGELAATRARLADEQAKSTTGGQDAATRLRAAQADVDRVSRELTQARADAEARRQDIAAADRTLKTNEAEVAKARATAAATETRLAKAQADLTDRDGRLKASEARTAKLDAQVAALQKDLAGARQAAATPAPDLAAREAKLAAQEARIKDLEAKLARVGSAGLRTAGPVATRNAPAAPSRMPASSKFGFSTSYALLIGESNYRDPKLQKLATPGNDVNQLGGVLRNRYGFNVEILLDKSRADILRSLDALAQKLGEHDTLLIYYAGHGGMEKVRNGEPRGYWLPVDAEYGSSASQISNQEITYQVARMAARKVLIVADSCYSGLLTQTVSRAQRPQSVDEKTNDYLIGMAWKQSRNVMTSGRLEPVLDGGGAGNHSVFASALIDVLKSNTDVITSEEIYSRLVTRVMSNATRVLIDERDTPDPQQPTYSALDNGGHVYGDFLFVPKTGAVAVATPLPSWPGLSGPPMIAGGEARTAAAPPRLASNGEDAGAPGRAGR